MVGRNFEDGQVDDKGLLGHINGDDVDESNTYKI